jgi:hypothetical protein
MDFWVRLGANHSDSRAIARIRNDAWRKKTRFYAGAPSCILLPSDPLVLLYAREYCSMNGVSGAPLDPRLRGDDMLGVKQNIKP